MGRTNRKAPAKPKTAHQKRVTKLTAGGKPGPKKKSAESKIMSKKKITNKEAAKVLKKQSKARKLKREVKKHMKDNKPYRQKNYA